MDIKITKNNDKFDVLVLDINHGKICSSINEIEEYINEQNSLNKDKKINLYIDKNINNYEYDKIVNIYKKHK